MNLKPITKSQYLNSYSFHKKDYWKRMLNNKFDIGLLKCEEKIPNAKKLFKNNVDNINLETSSYCNRECGYCPVSIYGRNYKHSINDKIFNNILSALKEIEYERSICLNLYNEPLADEKFYLILKKIRQILPKSILQTNSNGDYIKNLGILKDLESSGLNKIKISLHVPKNQSYSREFMKLSLKRYAKKIGYKLNDYNIKNLNFHFNIGKLFVEVQCPNWFIYGNYRGGTLTKIKNGETRSQPCVKPFREFTIYYDGNVTPCCDIYSGNNYKKNNISKIDYNDKYSIFKIYTQKKISDWRRDLFGWNEKKGVCLKCSSPDLAIKNDMKKRQNIFNSI